MQIWGPEELELTSEITKVNLKEDRKQRNLRHLNRATRVVCAPSVIPISISFANENFNKYVEKKLGIISECFISEVTG